ncbi:MAG: nodV [Verrucomicrobia bacterium]|nr:nodV [Verrucomicrobiota bacterium]
MVGILLTCDAVLGIGAHASLLEWVVAFFSLAGLGTWRAGGPDEKTEHALQVLRGQLLARPELSIIDPVVEEEGDRARSGRLSHLSEMSAVIAHELRQPLAAIICSAHAANRYMANSDSKMANVGEMLDDIISAGEHAESVIERLQAMARREPVEYRSVDLNGIVGDTVRMLKNDFAMRTVTVREELAENLSLTFGDVVQLKQVIGNLLLNACDAMDGIPADERVITVRTFRRAQDQIALAVLDGGVGLSPEIQKNLFRPFHSGKADGVGIGLAISRTIAIAHRGEIYGTNNPGGRGALFTLVLPIPDSPSPAALEFNDPAPDRLCRR